MLQVYLDEYGKLKEEQAQRIGFRDNIIYVTLGLFGGVLSFALSDKTHLYALLVIPWICLILGWTYLVNDEKISAIGKYIRLTLSKKIYETTKNTTPEENIQMDLESIFGWETAHRSDKRRKKRKIEQLIIDQITFVLSGIIALFTFWFSASNIAVVTHILCAIELVTLIALGVEIFMYADLAEGR
ncbi:conserved membrane hypothetical protein [Hyella patelloides LEGE 07179]|uniref:Integral membrane protein n=1 Tax=Hyella patelloides LEGE 07179 TaxID=945734 RepID=A0A563VLI9_9CYAN|nr:hypothetical protein [Hyella patelloides]VEP12175.1 conserved membrane hypothetical protein [Hyella patelloides LEGE 07179]